MSERPLEYLANLFRFDDSYLDMLVGEFTPEDWLDRLGGANPPLWIVAHVAGSRRQLRRWLGEKLPAQEWEPLVRIGSSPDGLADAGRAPEMVAAFKEAGAGLAARLEGMSRADADAPFDAVKFPSGAKTLGEAAHFLYFHESGHLGQLSLIRRARGYPVRF